MKINHLRKSGLSIGQISDRTGLAVSAIRHYESEGLVTPFRNAGNQRQFAASDIRKLSFVMISQQLGFTLAEIRGHLALLPDGKPPTKRDWERISKRFAQDIDARITQLTTMREKLTGCIGCGCLSLQACKLYNPEDRASRRGKGPRYLMGDPVE